jgi:hypothetical protein
MKTKLIILACIPLLILGCSQLFDKGDVEKSYDGPALLEFKPLQTEVNLADGEASIAIQLIGEQRPSDLSVSFSVDDESTAEEEIHYVILTPSPVTLSSGTSATEIVIELIEGSLGSGESVRLTLDLEGSSEVEPAENLKTSDIFISG